MNERYYIEINPLEKVDDIIEIFKEYTPKVFSKKDNGYDWLEDENSKCIVFENPFYDNQMIIDVSDMGEFSLFFAKSHIHYANYQVDYDQMIDKIINIFNNGECAGVITDSTGKWFGSGFFAKEDLAKPSQEVFDFVFKEKEFRDKLSIHGYIVEYSFWNPIDNKQISG